MYFRLHGVNKTPCFQLLNKSLANLPSTTFCIKNQVLQFSGKSTQNIFVITKCCHMMPLQYTVDVSATENISWHNCYAFSPHWMSLLDQLCETATLTFSSPPPLCVPGLHSFAPSYVLKLNLVCVNEAASCSTSSPSPLPASFALHPSAEDSSLRLGLSESQQLQHHPLIRLCSILSILESIHFSQASQRCQDSHTPFSQICFLQPPCVAQDSIQAVTSWAGLPCCIPLFPPALLGLPLPQSPSSEPLHHNPLSEARFRKKQASCLFFLRKCLLPGQLVFHCPSGG